MTPSSFRGNKSALPQKPCLQCGRPMTWRRAWAKNWDEVRYCSDRCSSDAKAQRRHKGGTS
ncbi:MAG: DUF2256 domain-containing protein [Burkholderiaceae bacterium]|jgi:hypothetical protein